MRLRQQIGARLEVLASLADKQIAQEDASELQGEDKTVNSNFGAPTSQEKAAPIEMAPVAAAVHSNQPAVKKQSQTPMKPVAGTDMTSPTVFPDAPMPTSINVSQYGT